MKSKGDTTIPPSLSACLKTCGDKQLASGRRKIERDPDMIVEVPVRMLTMNDLVTILSKRTQASPRLGFMLMSRVKKALKALVSQVLWTSYSSTTGTGNWTPKGVSSSMQSMPSLKRVYCQTIARRGSQAGRKKKSSSSQATKKKGRS